MCGIVYVKRTDDKDAIRATLKRYEEQASRGKQGFGFVAACDDRVVAYERDETEEGIKKKLKQLDTEAEEHKITIDELMFHHRFPTSTPNTENTAHPIFVSNNVLKFDYYVVHNGVVTNPLALRGYHDRLLFEYTTEVEIVTYMQVKRDSRGRKLPKSQRIHEERIETKFNDSEALAIELALWNEDIIPKVRAEGSYAFVVWQVDKETKNIVKTHFGRKSSPLIETSLFELYCLTSESKEKDAGNIPEGIMYTEDRVTLESTERVFMEEPKKNFGYNTDGYSNLGRDTRWCVGCKDWERNCTCSDKDYEIGYGQYASQASHRRTCVSCQNEKPVKYFPTEGRINICHMCTAEMNDDEVVGTPSPYSSQLQLPMPDRELQDAIEEYEEVLKDIQEYEDVLDNIGKKDPNYWEWYAMLDAARGRLAQLELTYDIKSLIV